MVALGALSTGAAFACFAVLIGQVGAPRASVTVYLVPVVAILPGAGLAAEAVAPLSVAGVVLVLVGAHLAFGQPRRGGAACQHPLMAVSGRSTEALRRGRRARLYKRHCLYP